MICFVVHSLLLELGVLNHADNFKVAVDVVDRQGVRLPVHVDDGDGCSGRARVNLEVAIWHWVVECHTNVVT